MNEDQLLATQAKQDHRRTKELDAERSQVKDQRDRAFIRLHVRFHWSYGKIARVVGCSPELVAYTMKHPPTEEAQESFVQELTNPHG